MKLTNWIVNKVGADKVIHFLTGAWLVSAVSPFGLGVMGWTAVAVILLSVIKEYCLDDKADWGDISAAGLGCAASFVAYVPYDVLQTAIA